jgi:hypothetical protein
MEERSTPKPMPSAFRVRFLRFGSVWVVWTACLSGVLFTASQIRARLADLPRDSIGQWTAESSAWGPENPSQATATLFGSGAIDSLRNGWRNRDGLGMLTQRERAAELGGTIEVRSSPGDGTVVRVEFELVQTGKRI